MAKYKLNSLKCVRCEPPIAFLKSSLGDFDGTYEIRRLLTLHASLRSSSCSIISFNIGSWISQSWKAAVSFVTVLPSKMCALWSFEKRDRSASAPASRGELRCLLLHTACLRYPVQCGRSRCPPELQGLRAHTPHIPKPEQPDPLPLRPSRGARRVVIRQRPCRR